MLQSVVGRSSPEIVRSMRQPASASMRSWLPGRDSMADHDAFEVGYKKPPQQTRFVKGQSGNPKGRPKGAKGLANLLFKIGRERVKVQVNGRSRTISKL